MRRKLGLALLTIWTVAAVAAAAQADQGDLIGLPDAEVSNDDLAATSVPPPDAAADGTQRRLLALGADQGLNRRPPQRIDTPAWILPPFENIVLGLAQDTPLGPPPEPVEIILTTLPDPVAP
jgi:hypothetical protein